MVLLTSSASFDGLRPPPGLPATKKQNAVLYCGLSLVALGTGGIKPCVSCFGADQFDEADEEEAQKKYSFFNWFFFGINIGAIVGITILVYIFVKRGWVWGFIVPTAAVVVSLSILVAGSPVYRYQKPMGSPFTRFLQVLVVASRNHVNGVVVANTVEEGDLYEVKTKESDIVGARKLQHTSRCRFLDKAAVVTDEHDISTSNRWRLCTVTQVEELKCLIRLLPVWVSTIALSISFTQISTFFIIQATIMDRKLSPNFIIPPASIPFFTAVNALVLVPIYEGIVVPILRRFTGNSRGITSLQRMGIGLFVSIIAFAFAAVVEKQRRNSYDPKSMSVFWLFPQFFLMGSAEVFTYVGQLEFFYDEATDGTRSLSSAMFLSEFGIGSWLSTLLVNIVKDATGGVGNGWLRNNLNQSKLDYFYWILCGINAVGFLVYVVVAINYKGEDGTARSVMDKARGEREAI